MAVGQLMKLFARGVESPVVDGLSVSLSTTNEGMLLTEGLSVPETTPWGMITSQGPPEVPSNSQHSLILSFSDLFSYYFLP